MTDPLFDDEEDFTGRVRRMRNGRPYVLANPDWTEADATLRGFSNNPNEPRGRSRAYTRTTTYISALEDTYSLGQHQERGVVVGMASRPSLCAKANAVDLTDELSAKAKLNAIAEEARDAAGWNEKRELGTAFHDLAEVSDRGERISPRTDDVMLAMLAAYRVATEGWEYAHIEQGVINDELGYYGTPDRLTWIRCELCANEQRANQRPYYANFNALSVDDIKTGRIDYGQPKMALQEAAYAIGQLYDPDTGIRTDLPICRHYGRIIHVPYGEGTCTVYPVPLAPAIDALTTLVPAVRAYRSKGTWFDAPVRPGLRSGVAASWPERSPEAL